MKKTVNLKSGFGTNSIPSTGKNISTGSRIIVSNTSFLKYTIKYSILLALLYILNCISIIYSRLYKVAFRKNFFHNMYYLMPFYWTLINKIEYMQFNEWDGCKYNIDEVDWNIRRTDGF